MATQHQYHESYVEFFQRFADNSVDFIFMDPPYEVLTGHKIEKPVDKELVFKEAYRVLKPSGFIVFTGQEPTILNWHIEARKLFKYSDKIIWSKRIITSPYLRLQRTYEEVCIYYKHAGKQPDYYEKHERYEDLKEGALHLGLYELSTIRTTLSDLQHRLNDPSYNDIYNSGAPMVGEPASENDKWINKKYYSGRNPHINKDKEMFGKNNDAYYVDNYGRAEKNRKKH